MRLVRTAALVLLLALPAVTDSAGAEQPSAAPGGDLAEKLPRAWCGTFSWVTYNDLQHVTITFDRVAVRADGRLEATGRGVVRSFRVVPFQARAVVEPEGLRVELFESVAAPTPGYITDGSHVGTLAGDLQSMRLVWTTRGTGERGTMQLIARPAGADPAQPCGLPSS